MSRATQWEPLCEVDPTPGEADEVERAGRHYASMAHEIQGQVGRLGDLVDSTLEGQYVQTLTNAAEGLKGELGKASGRYREVGGALEGWAPQLRGFQDEAETLRRQAETAQGDMAANHVIPQLTAVGAPPPADAEVAAAKAKASRYDDARGDLDRVQGRLGELTERRDNAAAKVADAIRDSCDDDVANSGWDDFKDWMDNHADLVRGICKVLGVIAMAACVLALFIPGLNILAGIALVAGVGSLLGHSALAATGNGSWVDVGLDVVALATLGAGRFLGPGIKVLGRPFGGALTRLTGEAKAAGAVARGNLARGPIQARVGAEVAKAQERLIGGVSRRVARSVRLDVKAIRGQGVKDSQEAFDAAQRAYLARQAPTKVLERLALGGGDPEIAALRLQAQDAARGFSETSRVGLAAARAEAQAVKAVGFTAASTVTSGWSLYTDFFPVKPYDDWRNNWPTKVKGDE